MCRFSVVATLVVVVALFAGLCIPGESFGEDGLYELRENLARDHDDTVTVMSFNVRLDGLESDENNHFTRRVFRLRDTITRWHADLVGMQEPFGGQVHHMLLEFPKGHPYRALGYNRQGVDNDDLAHPSRYSDVQCGILYNTETLELLEQGYRWLSETPERPSKSWGSIGVRTVNIAVFKVKRTGRTLLHLNTHLDVWSELARRGQAAVLQETVTLYKARYPDAAVFVTGDFNSAPGQTPHRVLLDKEAAFPLQDAWVGAATKNQVSATFHGWQGTLATTYAARLLSSVLFTMHAMGLNMPTSVPTTPRRILSALKDSVTVAPKYSVAESMPGSFWDLSRFHVDWVLHTSEARPVMSVVADVRNTNFSSDHFPLVAVFHV